MNDIQFWDERALALADGGIRLVRVKTEDESSFLRVEKFRDGTVRFDSSGNKLLMINSQNRIEVISLRQLAQIFYAMVFLVLG